MHSSVNFPQLGPQRTPRRGGKLSPQWPGRHTPRTPARFVAAALVARARRCVQRRRQARATRAGARPARKAPTPSRQCSRSAKIDIQTWGAEVKLSKDTKKTARWAWRRRYFDTAVHDPLGSGKVGAGYAALFEKGVRPAATGRDEKAMTDVSLGQASKYTRERVEGATSPGSPTTRARCSISRRPSPCVVNATTAKGPMRIARDVELTYAPSGKNWLVTAYRVKTRAQDTQGEDDHDGRGRRDDDTVRRRPVQSPDESCATRGARGHRTGVRARPGVHGFVRGVARRRPGADRVGGHVPACPEGVTPRRRRIVSPAHRVRRSSSFSSATISVRVSAARAVTRCTCSA